MADLKPPKFDTNKVTREYLDSILIEQRLIGSVLPNLEIELFGERFASPIMMPAFSHLRKFLRDERPNGMVEYALAAKNLNLVNYVGMGPDEEFREILDTGAKTVRIIKPYADKDKIFEQIEFAKKNGAIAVGMDIDHIFGSDGQYDLVFEDRMGPQSDEDLRSYIEFAEIPFVVKGVLSAFDAVNCAEIGAAAILVSHHSGRMPFAIPPLKILPEITGALGKCDMKIFVDCGIATGADAFKALALGADAVAVGRAMMPALIKEGQAGVEAYITKMNQELAYIMGFTGSRSVSGIDPGVLHF
ncbi:MAG: alpha-hydroxy-acid oxidizing protein [Eubacteriales bacterium]|nr:alpha-hydroxy-acid oxidizing protein [Eubacteriales bacterium]